MHQLSSGRVSLTIEDGPAVEVVGIGAWPIYHAAAGLVSAYLAKEDDIGAYREALAFFLVEAQPAFTVADHRGPIPPTLAGMLRLPVPIALGWVIEWAGTFIPKATAADALLPDGPVKDQVNATLRRKKRAG